MAVSDSAVGEAFRALRQGRCQAVAHRAMSRGRAADRAIALGSGADSHGRHDVPAGRADPDHRRRRPHPGRHGRAYLCENYGGAFTLPERGPIGANCLANARDFLTPVAAYEDKDTPTELFVKWGGSLFATKLPHSPIDVVAWHGNYAPYKYDLRTFSPVGAIGFDHPDPSIFTVLTSPSETAGTANIDFVIFPERWAVAENTFRPPWYHMNIMSEFMGLIYGVYDAKPRGFTPGGISLHNCMLPHGPDRQAFDHASNSELKPVKLTGTMAFMFETRYPQRVTAHAAKSSTLQDDYADCWKGLEKRFDPNRP